MPLEVSKELRTWITRHGLTGYLNVLEAPPHPKAQAIARKIHPDTISNNMIRVAPPQHILEQHFGEYSLSAKAHHTHGGHNEFFWNLAHFLLEYAFVHANPYSMPKKKVGIIVTTYIGG